MAWERIESHTCLVRPPSLGSTGITRRGISGAVEARATDLILILVRSDRKCPERRAGYTHESFALGSPRKSLFARPYASTRVSCGCRIVEWGVEERTTRRVTMRRTIAMPALATASRISKDRKAAVEPVLTAYMQRFHCQLPTRAVGESLLRSALLVVRYNRNRIGRQKTHVGHRGKRTCTPRTTQRCPQLVIIFL